MGDVVCVRVAVGVKDKVCEGVCETVMPAMDIPVAAVKTPRIPPAPRPVLNTVHETVFVPITNPLPTGAEKG